VKAPKQPKTESIPGAMCNPYVIKPLDPLAKTNPAVDFAGEVFDTIKRLEAYV